MGSSTRTWRPRRITFPEDRPLLQSARTQFYGQCDGAYLDWLYGANPAGPLFSHLAVDGGVIAGQYIVIPVDMVRAGAPFKATLSLDTFTHESYRRQGIFVSLAEEVYRDAAAAGSRFTIGLPNENSHHGFVKNLKFSEPFGVSVLARPLGSVLLGRRLARRLRVALHPLHHLSRAQVDTPSTIPTAWIDRLWETRRPATTIGLAKTGAWFRWRFESNPRDTYRFVTAEVDGEPAGVLVWSLDRPDGSARASATIVDVEAKSRRCTSVLVGALLERLEGSVDVVRALATPRSTLGRALLLSGFVPVRRLPFIVRMHGDDPALQGMLNGAAWAVSGAYADWL